jgi:hypothetical protein
MKITAQRRCDSEDGKEVQYDVRADDALGMALACKIHIRLDEASHVLYSQTIASRPGSRNGKGLRKAAFTTLKIAVFAPMPRTSANSATAVKAGALQSMRAPKRMSLHTDSMLMRGESKLHTRVKLMQGLVLQAFNSARRCPVLGHMA